MVLTRAKDLKRSRLVPTSPFHYCPTTINHSSLVYHSPSTSHPRRNDCRYGNALSACVSNCLNTATTCGPRSLEAKGPLRHSCHIERRRRPTSQPRRSSRPRSLRSLSTVNSEWSGLAHACDEPKPDSAVVANGFGSRR